MKISLAPVPYHWDLARIKQFYREVSDLPLDIVYLGETVCSRRREARLKDWLQIADQLATSGIEPVLTTLALTEAESELSALRRITANGCYRIEANDMAAVNLRAPSPFVIGPHINIYNDKALTFLKELGAVRWVVPVEVGKHNLTGILEGRPAGMETEVTAFGRLPLAFSARCFSARAHNRGKDDCGFVCKDYPDGLVLNTQDDDPFLFINGVQIQSTRTQNLLRQLDELASIGVDILRIVPQMNSMREIIRTFRDVLDGGITTEDGMTKLSSFQQYGCSDGYWRQQPGMEWQ